jgi:chromosome segregation ATPase
MDDAFIDLRQGAGAGAGGDTFWPSFTDIMMVIVMIFMMASTVLVMRNWDLVQELRATIEAERQAEELARSMTETSATLEEQLAQAQHINSEMRMQLMRADENRQSLQERLSVQEQQILVLTKEQQELATSLQESRLARQQTADQLARVNTELARVSAEYEQLTTTHTSMRERLQQALSELAASEQTSREQAVELAGLRQEHSLSTRQLDTLQGEYDELSVKYDRLIRPARSAKDKYVVTVRYWKEDGYYQLRFKDAGEEDYSVVTRKELHRRLSKLKEEQAGKLYVKLIIPDDSGLSYNEAWGFTVDILDKYDYYHQKQEVTQ